jgi:ABC-2 type transport system ATP-binding protein
MQQPVISIKGVKKSFGKKIVLDNVNLDVRKGEIFGVIGLSGSGKTTLFNSLIGFIEPEEGHIFYNHPVFPMKSSVSIFDDLLEVRKVFGFAPQIPSFYPKLTAEENLDHFGSLYGINKFVRKKNIDYLLKLVDLYDSRDTLGDELSGGMQKRLSIACALIHNPKVLILDEPTADLDPHLRNQTWEVLKNINKQGTTVIVSSHFLEEVEVLCDRVGILHNGSMLEVGSPDELKDAYSKNEEIHLETSPGKYDLIYKKLRGLKSLSIKKVVNKGSKMIIYTPKAEETLHKLLHLLESMHEHLLDVYVNKPSLEEVFESLTNKSVRLDKR